MTEVQNDPDRVLHPLRRRPRRRVRAGHLGRRRSTRSASGSARSAPSTAASAVGWYMGNPGAFSLLAPALGQGLPRRARLAALLHGLLAGRLQPVRRQRAALRLAVHASRSPTSRAPTSCSMVGANPLVSHGSVLSAPRIKDQLHAITDRGGRVVVVDPRRSETARAFEHLPIDPDADAWLLLSMLAGDLRRGARGRATRSSARRAAPTPCASSSRRIPAGGDRGAHRRRPPSASASSPATSPPPTRAAVYGRTGSCLGRNGTLVAFLLDALNARHRQPRPRGRRDVRRRRRSTSSGIAELDRRSATYGKRPLAGRRLPRGARRAAGVADGEGDHDARARARSGRCSSPPATRCSRVPERRRARGGDRASSSSAVAIDLYVSDTARHADYVLPATTLYEREDFPLPFLALFTTPFIQMTEAVVEPRRRGAPGVGGHRGDLASGSASCRRASLAARCSAGPGSSCRRGGSSTCCCAPAPRATCSACAAAASASAKLRRQPARDRARRAPRARRAARARSATATGGCASTRPRSRAEVERLAPRRTAHDPRLPAAADRPARAALPQLLDAQRAAADARRPRPRRPHPSRRRRRRPGSRTATRCRISSAHGEIEIEALVTDEVMAGHGRRAARLGPRRRLARRRTRPAARTSTCSPPRSPTTSSGSPGWRT